MNEIVSNLATRGSGNAAAVVLDRWRALALGGGGDVGDKAGIAPVARPTEVRYIIGLLFLFFIFSSDFLFHLLTSSSPCASNFQDMFVRT